MTATTRRALLGVTACALPVASFSPVLAAVDHPDAALFAAFDRWRAARAAEADYSENSGDEDLDGPGWDAVIAEVDAARAEVASLTPQTAAGASLMVRVILSESNQADHDAALFDALLRPTADLDA